MNQLYRLCLLLLVFTVAAPAIRACIWDAETLDYEKARSKDLATAILGDTNAPAPAEDPVKLRARIADLQAHPNEASVDWWNNLAGAYLRLNQPADAVKLLEPVMTRFFTNYGVHANLGTAYHLLCRYADAEKEIAHDLEINPDAHFGLEKYHLALLQYLSRDAKYQARHVYVDEATSWFLEGYTYIGISQEEDSIVREAVSYSNNVAAAEQDFTDTWKVAGSNWIHGLSEKLAVVAILDEKPAYRSKWNLVDDTNFVAGVIYMAQMNPKEPACAVMLGVAASRLRDYNLAVKSYENAITLHSPQSDLLRARIVDLKDYIKHSTESRHDTRIAVTLGMVFLLAVGLLVILILCYIVGKIRAACR